MSNKGLLRGGVVVLVGAPLSGKGTQAARLSALWGVPAVSTGDLFRAEARTGSALGLQMKAYMDSGELIPNELTTKFLTEKLSEPQFQRGFVLDGYPRNPSHLTILDDILLQLDRELVAALYFEIPKEKLLTRIASRMTCPTCGAIFSIPPSEQSSDNLVCSVCANGSSKLVRRVDDDISVFERRYAVFEKETLPLIPVLKSRGQLITVDCAKMPDAASTTQQIESAMTSFIAEINSPLDSYGVLEQYIQRHAEYCLDTVLQALLKGWLERALRENILHRTGLMRRFVFLKTTNMRKYREHLGIFEAFYGIEVLRVPPSLPDSWAEVLLKFRDSKLVPLAVIREESNLFKPHCDEFSSLRQGVRAVNRASLTAISLSSSGSELVTRTYSHETAGRIDLTRRRATSVESVGSSASATVPISSNSSVFGWDDIFVVDSNNMSYHELREFGVKHSSRDFVVSEFIRDSIYYKNLLNLNFNKQDVSRPIDFSLDLAEFVGKNAYFSKPQVAECGYGNLLTHVLNSGIFVRAAQNRRENNYWCPGLNGGIPLVAKRDEIHQITFMSHDFGHFAIPDLIYVGNNSIHHRRAYIAWRMVSESSTMALADMLFVDALKRSGIEYDWNARRIWPLFNDLGLISTDLNQMRAVIRANYQYCLKGDCSAYKELLRTNKSSEESLNRFKEKFAPFFVEDFRYTEHNYNNMVKQSDQMQRWWSSVGQLRRVPGIEMMSIDDFLHQLRLSSPQAFDDPEDGSAMLDAVFDYVFERQIKPVLVEKAELLPKPQRLFRGFVKWMTGQLAICEQFHFVPESVQVRSKIIDLILSHGDGRSFSLADVGEIRAEYEAYLQLLLSRNLISPDDLRTYSEVYPLFAPFFVNYDLGESAYEDLSHVSRRVLSLSNHRTVQLNSINHILGRDMQPSERHYLSSMLAMIEAGNGQVQDGLFVTKPGVMLLAHTKSLESNVAAQPDWQATFLIAGIAVETSLELVAHKEARVARLTSSKTNAMNSCLFRVQGLDVLPQRRLLEHVLEARAHFEARWNPRKRWEDGNELYNMTLPACKATSLCYTMKLEDFHSLFIGRMGPAGNEREVREVVWKMCDILHGLYPQFISAPDVYLRDMSNKNKYTAPTPIKPADSNSQSNELVAQSVLTHEAKILFKLLKLPSVVPDYVLLSEFCSKITYLAFPREQETVEHSLSYISKMTREHFHLSVLAAFQTEFVIDGQRNLYSLKEILQGLLGKSIKSAKLAEMAHSHFPAVIQEPAVYL